jgi:hypothetical protein
MRNKIIFFSFVLFLSITLSACSKNLNIKETKDYIWDKIALQEKLDLLEQQKQNFNLPSRAKKLNISTPTKMTLDKESSYQTSEDVEWFNSMRFVYTGDYNTAMQQAEKIAKDAGIKISEEFKMAQDIIQQMWSGSSNHMQDLMWDLKGIVYTNYSLTKNPESENIISISVEEDWTLEIVVTDRKNMQNIVSDKLK